MKILLGLSSTVGTILALFICFNIVEPILKTLIPENRFLIASITTRIFVVTLAGMCVNYFNDGPKKQKNDGVP